MCTKLYVNVSLMTIRNLIISTQTTLAHLIYVATLSTPFVLSALFMFGASGFGNFEDAITNAIPIPSVTVLLGIDNDFTEFLTGLVGTLYELLEDGIEAVVDLLLSIPSDDSFNAAITSQFSGCIISIFFIVS